MIYLRNFNSAMDAKGQVIDLPCVVSLGGGNSSNVDYFSLYQKDSTKLNVTDNTIEWSVQNVGTYTTGNLILYVNVLFFNAENNYAT